MVNHFYTTITATTSLITLEKAKKQLRLDAGSTDEDDLIQSYIDAAQTACENFINRGISKRDFVMELSAFETPVTFERNYENDVITKIEYYAPGETTLTLLPANQYQLRKSNTVECFDIKFSSMPATATAKRDDAVLITVSQGFDLASCPKPIIQAINLRLSDFYERREDREQGSNPASNNLLRAYRKY
jgi:uncharacterized phage protein (predicted DNA packaging)